MMKMNSSCVAGCLDAQEPIRATFLSLNRWPDSDAEFVRILSFKEDRPKRPREYDCYASRQMYLRSYTFSRRETVPDKTKKCIGKVKDTMSKIANPKRKKHLSLVRKIREKFVSTYHAALAAIFHHLLACTTSVDVSDQSLK
eukprot:Gb_23079 [translate_table: standard]